MTVSENQKIFIRISGELQLRGLNKKDANSLAGLLIIKSKTKLSESEQKELNVLWDKLKSNVIKAK